VRVVLAFTLIAACAAPPESIASSEPTKPPQPAQSSGAREPAPSTPSTPGPTDPAPTAKTLAAEPTWNDGTSCNAPDVETWKLDDATYVLRQSLCTNFEAPFMTLFVGDDKALLVDSGTGDADIVAAVDAVLAGKDVDLLVARSHAHGDHTGGEADLASRPRTTLLKQPKTATIDLGNRVLDVIPIPGHEASHVAYYDAQTRVLLTGDTLYPGRLYVRDFAAYKTSVARLASFVDTHPVSLVLGAHVELSKTNTEFKAGVKTHPNEHALSFAVSDVHDLHATTEKMSAPARVVGPRWVIVPVE
jgi:hydroxyacylglutathione hydrolase